jgi:signal transduction histidine kinase/ActR/RegA family two-component response regulator
MEFENIFKLMLDHGIRIMEMENIFNVMFEQGIRIIEMNDSMRVTWNNLHCNPSHIYDIVTDGNLQQKIEQFVKTAKKSRFQQCLNFKMQKAHETLDCKLIKSNDKFVLICSVVPWFREYNEQTYNNVPVVVITMNQYDEIVALNDRVRHVLGVERDEYVNKQLCELVKSEEFMIEWYRVKSLLDEQFKRGGLVVPSIGSIYLKTGILQAEKHPFRFEAICGLTQGTKYYTLFLSDESLMHDMKNEISDLSELHRALMTIINKAGIYLYTLDLEGNFNNANVMAQKDYPEVLKGIDLAGIELMRKQVIELGLTVFKEFKAETPSGPRFYWTTAAPKRDKNENTVGIYAMSQDITDYKKNVFAQLEGENERLHLAQQLSERASQMKSEFLARMSHELRTPLSVIIGSVPLLGISKLDDDQQEQVSTIKGAAGQLLSMVNDLLDFSNMETGKIAFDNYDFDIYKLLDDLNMLFAMTAKQKGLKFEIENCISEEHRYVCGDYGRIIQVISNVVNNALKFTSVGHVIIKVYIESPIEDKEMLIFEVEDTGIGIPLENHQRLFQPFNQGDETTTRKFGGTGIGLSISSTLITMMEGEIAIKSEKSKGSTFYIKLPYEQAKEKQVPLKESWSPVSQIANSDCNGKSILVTEDNPMIQKVVLRLIRMMGYDVIGCSDGVEALELLKLNSDKFCLVMMDLFMPNKDGYETALEIRKLPSPLRDIPIVAMTANVVPGERENVKRYGMDDYIPKPVSYEALHNMIDKWRGKSHHITI